MRPSARRKKFSLGLPRKARDLAMLVTAAAALDMSRPGVGVCQTLVRGRVLADSGRRPLAGAEIVIAGERAVAVTSPDGQFQLGALPAGQYRLLVRHVGYQPQRREIALRSSDTLDILVLLRASAQPLDSITVEGHVVVLSPGLLDMEQRRIRGIGKFITTAELRDLDGRRGLTELLRKYGINFERDPWTKRLVPVSPRGLTEMSLRSCRMQVVLDWAPLDISPLHGVDLESIPISSLGGIEVYKGISETPLIFERGPDAACGVIVLWTRER